MSQSFLDRITRHIETWAYTLTMDEEPDALVDELEAAGLPEHQIDQVVALAEHTTELAQAVEEDEVSAGRAESELARQYGLDPAIAQDLIAAARRGVSRAIEAELQAEEDDEG